jgi:predicted transcriptional regulator
MASLTLELPDELQERLHALARELQRDAEDVARDLLEQATAAETARLAAIDEGAGAFAGCPGSSEDIRRWRDEEIAEQERRDRERQERWPRPSERGR